MCDETDCRMDYEALLADPLTRLVMDSDGVTERDLIAVLVMARDARVAQAHA